ncbi:4Fe-4S cluster-binding domain-containing protein, partial [bacterium]|nr:4Fe-4S cluster-binding domain-containing protein [bacterium]
MMDIISFHVELTYKCNNKCFYCYNNLHQISTHMKFEDAKIVISLIKENLKKGKHVNLILTGGEPFQNFRVLYYICFSLIQHKNIEIS